LPPPNGESAVSSGGQRLGPTTACFLAPNKPKRPLQGELIRLGARFVIVGTDANYVLAGARRDTTALRSIKID
jgi:hypothetical protein